MTIIPIIQKQPLGHIPDDPPACRRAYDNHDVRRAILRLLDKGNLTRFMAVEKGGMREVASLLYKEVDFDLIYCDMADPTPNQQIYCDAIRTIDAELMTISYNMLQMFGPKPSELPSNRNPRAGYHEDYDKEYFNYIVPPLRRKCRGLREIMFGCRYQPFAGTGATWRVEFDQPVADINQSHELDTGRIEHIRYLDHHLADGPPTAFVNPPVPPSPGYTVNHFFDLWTYPTQPFPSALSELWLSVIRDHPMYAHIYGAVHFFNLPINLQLLETIYERQATVGNAGRLEYVKSSGISPFDLRDFQRFAVIASTSLHTLHLFDDEDRPQERTMLSFRDLPALIHIIETHLPTLEDLRLSVKDIGAAEAICAPLLHADSLKFGGKIRRLKLNVDGVQEEPAPPTFNLIRYLSCLLAPDAELGISPTVLQHLLFDDEQTSYHKYLRQQPDKRKGFLSTIDFGSLGITRLDQVLELSYELDGRPQRRIEAKARDWARHIANSGKAVTQTHLLPLVEGISESLASISRLTAISGTADDAELLIESEALLAVMESTQRAVAAIAGHLSGGTVEDVREYVRSLKGQIAGAIP